MDVGRGLRAFKVGCARKIGPRRRVEVYREAKLAKPGETFGEMVDGVVGRRHRGVPALIEDLQPVVEVHLFHRLQAVADQLAVLDADAASLVEGVLGVDQVAVVLDEPLDA